MSKAGRAAYAFRADVRAKSQAATFCETFRWSTGRWWDHHWPGSGLLACVLSHVIGASRGVQQLLSVLL